ncbi:sugar-binding protein [Wenjunlia vitaminophila]|uniref:Sugar-binding protein n=1 Tax=Wenjunlia vitaminophila TaxID=76728 RepID=A0A0T6LP92_WENVI|nr:sugar-binding protein [Wenjunlia vitaminophila]
MLLATLATACGDDGDDSGDGGKVTLNLGLFGTMPYEEAGLFEEYESLHPDIKIKYTSPSDEQNYYRTLQTRLAANSGLADIQAVEVGRIREVVETHAAKFTDMSKAPGVKEGDWLPWKWQQAKAADGKVIGLGTDIGPMALCYRKDMFAKAGLPSDREQVAALWESGWDGYVEAGKKFKADYPDDGVAFMDTASGLYNAMIASSEKQYYDADGKVIYKDNDLVTKAWDLSTEAAEAGLTAKLRQFDTAWDQGFSNSRFATVVCPAWMTAHISDKAGEANKGKWDIAAPPAGANWGGSFLTVPSGGKHVKEAQELAAWLTAPEQQAKLFAKNGLFPSSSKAMEAPEVSGATLEYFDGAPSGKIFSESATSIPVTVLGPKDGAIKDNVSNGIQLVEQQGKDPDDAWKSTVETIDKDVLG